jgi:hypothetical protein
VSFNTLLLLSLLEEGCSHSFEQTFNSLPLRMICAKYGKNWPSPEAEVENVKVYKQTDGRTTGDQKISKKQAKL